MNMKSHGRRQQSGSFGIPQPMQEARQAFEEKKAADAQKEAEADAADEDDVGEGEEGLEEAAEAASLEEKALGKKPRAALAEVGIVLEDKDFHNILYRGFVEKDVELVPALGTIAAMVVRLKTLTPEEYNTVDELVGEELETTKGTTHGFQVRRELWMTSFAVIAVQGRELTKIKPDKDGNIDLKELARGRYKILKQLSPAVIDKLIKTISVMSWAINAIVENPKANF